MTQLPQVAAEIFALYPGYVLGVVSVAGASNGKSPPELVAELRAAEAEIRSRIARNVAEQPQIASWRDAYRRFGARPSDYRSSIEALARRVLKPDALPSINRLVDIGNIVSLRFVLPAGVHPFPAAGTPTVRVTAAGDTFDPPDGSPAEVPSAGEVVFANGSQVLTRRWTWRQAAGTQTSEHCGDVFFNVDGLLPVDEVEVRSAMDVIAHLVQKYCGGQISTSLIRD